MRISHFVFFFKLFASGFPPYFPNLANKNVHSTFLILNRLSYYFKLNEKLYILLKNTHNFNANIKMQTILTLNGTNKCPQSSKFYNTHIICSEYYFYYYYYYYSKYVHYLVYFNKKKLLSIFPSYYIAY